MNTVKLVPARIKEARESYGLSMGELADMIGVTSSAVSEYEKGRINPSVFVLKTIANKLEFPLDYFYMPIKQYNCDNSAVYFRAMKTTPKKIKMAYTSRIKWAYEIYSYLSQYVELIPVAFPIVTASYNVDELDSATINRIALDVRRHFNLGLGPIDDITDLVESVGAVACGISFKNKKIEGFSQWFNGVPFIFHGSHRTSSVSLRFSIAHELAHLFLHSHITMDQIFEKEISDRMEEEANRFASSFLLPEDTFSTDLHHCSLEYFAIMKEKWKVSISAMILRAKGLGIISENQASYLYRQMAIKNQRIIEPLDNELPYEKPCTFSDSFNLLVDNNIKTSTEIINDLPYPQNEITTICSLESDFFQPNVSKGNKVALRLLNN